MYSLIFILGCLVVGIGSFIYGKIKDEEGESFVIIMGCIFIVILLSVNYTSSNHYISEANVFMAQKEYIESYEPENDIEKAALMNKKIELNTWLYESREDLEINKNWVRPVDVIFTLEEIK